MTSCKCGELSARSRTPMQVSACGGGAELNSPQFQGIRERNGGRLICPGFNNVNKNNDIVRYLCTC